MMPRSFLIKRIEKVQTGFFPWQDEMLVQSCCLEYRMGSEDLDCDEQKDKDIEVVSEDGIEESSSEKDSIRSQSPTEIKILTPYHNTPPPPLIIYSNKATNSCQESSEDTGSHTSEDTDSLVPSPLGCNDPTFINYHQQQLKSPTEPSAFKPYPHYYPSMVQSLANRCITPWPNHHHHHPSYEEAKKHQCEYCLKWFQRSSSLSNHRLIHKNSKSYKCNQCNMSFLRKSDLGKHMVTHSGSKPYQCNVCGKRFSQSSNMLTHQRRHTGIRPYSCGVCGKAFYRKVDVRRHASVHRNY
ncbi:zinc finger protein sens-like [Clytia hemisphaerica]|uniref:C2H2-type domain-containing protein n=1 Tax=Clytia hemisphaerica TaxID=252671 RepID=A0A7M5VDQ4_9CNID|eukprot:TCONS_00006137-protein